MALAGPTGAGPRDAVAGHVPCPLCGGLIHPVAGRCKHCKQDLVAHRAARASAAAPLPAILGAPGAVAASPRARETASAVLPTGPTGTAVAPVRSAWRSWPVIAIAVATVAIIVAIVLMLWPPHAHRSATPSGAPPAATEHMDTDPEPAQPDPWASPQGRADPVPAPNPAPLAPRPDPDSPGIAANPPQPHLPDPLPPDPPGGIGGGLAGGGTAGGGFGQLGGTTLGSSFMLTALAHACARLKTCPDPDASLSTMCDAFATLPAAPPPAGCAAAQRCLDAIDHLSCSQATGDMPAGVLMMFSDCSTAMTSC